jgi:formylglycine-generating enzyme required for sulfatase activity
MKAIKLLIILGVLLTAFLADVIALANGPSVFDSVSSDSTLAAPKLQVTITGTKVLLSWSKVAGATEYELHYAQYPYDNPDTIKTMGLGDKASASFDISPGDAYLVAVKACKDSGSDCSDYSNIHDVIIPLFSTFKNSLGQEFKLIWPETFTMGSPSDEVGRYSDEGPQHQVTLTQSFYMQTTEVTQAQWEAVMGSNPSYFSGCPSCPVEEVTWDDVQDYIALINLRGEGTYSLPTEAQWECAARAGSTTAFANGGIAELYCGYDSNLNVIGWYCGNSGYKTHPVAQKSPNAWGLYDMHGNVWEWCQDWYNSSYYLGGAMTDPAGPSSGSGRVLRGGGCGDSAEYCRSAYRGSYDFDNHSSNLGFRLLRQP